MTIKFSGGLTTNRLTVGPLPLPPDWTAPLTEQKIISSPQSNARFGISVSMSSDGSRMIAGAQFDDQTAADAGAAYVFLRTGADWTSWTQEDTLLSGDLVASDYLGESVDISDDGTVAVVGAPNKSTRTGAVYVFTRSGSVWTQQQKLSASDAQTNHQFGRAVTISGDGTTIVVGASWADDNGANSGAAYVFTESGGTWTQQQKLLPSDGAANDGFGTKVSLSTDGNTVAITSEPGQFSSTSPGAVYIFNRSLGTFTEQDILTGSDITLGSSRFGGACSLSGDGNTVAVGAYRHLAGEIGQAYVFTRAAGVTTPGAWSQQDLFTGSVSIAGDLFGFSVALNETGDYLLVGSPGDDVPGSNSGEGFVFTRSAGVWSESQTFTAADITDADLYGDATAISKDGRFGAFGSQTNDAGVGSGTGAVYMYSP